MVQGSGFGIWGSRFWMRGLGFRFLGARFGCSFWVLVLGARFGCRMQGARPQVSGFKDWSSSFGVRG